LPDKPVYGEKPLWCLPKDIPREGPLGAGLLQASGPFICNREAIDVKKDRQARGLE